MAHDDEAEAFRNFLDVFPEQATLLVDTYDVRRAIDKIIALGRKPAGVRLDSGDVLADSLWTRKRLDNVGWKDVQIFVSGDLDENRIEALLHRGAPIDAFGVGTALSTSADAPYVGVIYKLVEVELDHRVRGTAKFSEDKKTYPGRKQVFRFADGGQSYSGDIIGLEDETFPSAERLLIPAMRHGRRLEVMTEDPAVAVQTAQARFLAGRTHLPGRLLGNDTADPAYPVFYSTRLEELCELARQSLQDGAHLNSRRWPLVSAKTIFWEVDVQADFMLPGGSLYIPGAEKILANINLLVDAARQGRVFLISSADAHNPNDPEQSDWPPHCLKGTAGADLMPEACASPRLIIPNQEGFTLPEDLGAFRQVTLEKNTLDVFDNPNTDTLLARLNPAASSAFESSLQFVVFGVATEYCVRLTANGLLRRGYLVSVVTDAIRAIDQEKAQQTLETLHSLGVRLITTSEALTLVGGRLSVFRASSLG
jgi:nicotinamidase-related amidase